MRFALWLLFSFVGDRSVVQPRDTLDAITPFSKNAACAPNCEVIQCARIQSLFSCYALARFNSGRMVLLGNAKVLKED